VLDDISEEGSYRRWRIQLFAELIEANTLRNTTIFGFDGIVLIHLMGTLTQLSRIIATST